MRCEQSPFDCLTWKKVSSSISKMVRGGDSPSPSLENLAAMILPSSSIGVYKIRNYITQESFVLAMQLLILFWIVQYFYPVIRDRP